MITRWGLLLPVVGGLAFAPGGGAQPVITLQPRGAMLNAGGTANFTVTATAAAPIEYQWQFNGADLPNATNASLRITNLSLANLGSYRARVSGGGASTNSAAANLSLTVQISPEFRPGLALKPSSNGVALAWTGRSATNPAGPWTTLGAARTSYTATASERALFYRLRNPHPRSVPVFVPSTYRTNLPVPLMISLHGYTGSGQGHEDYFRIRPHAESNGFLYAFPDGVPNNGNFRFWNAANACCDFDNQHIDDSGFIRGLIERASRDFNVDPKRVHLLGHSNGGFMSFRAAQDHPDLIASVASLAGAMDREPVPPAPGQPVHILQIHGTADEIIYYNGGASAANLPRISRRLPMTGAEETVRRWAAWNGCGELQVEASPSLDLVSSLAGADTRVSRAAGCSGAEAELWTIQGGLHSPAFTAAFSREIVEWLLAHPKR